MTHAVLRSLVLMASALFVGCGGSRVEEPAAPSRVSVDLHDATVVEVAHALAAELHTPVVVAANASRIAWCTRITVSSGGLQPVARLIALTGEALAPVGLTIKQSAAGLAVAVREGSTLGTCPSAQPTPTALPDPLEESEVLAGIERRGAVVEVKRDVLRGLLHRHGLGGARGVPHMEDGLEHGVRVYGIRPGSVLAALGLQNGDTVVRVGDRPVHALDTLLEIYSQSQDVREVDVTIERRGAPTTLRYRITD